MARRALVAVGLGLLAVALVPPVSRWATERSFAVHMAQHLALGDLVPIVLVAALAPRIPRAVAVASLPVWLGDLAVWHIPGVFAAALRHSWLHGVEHAALFAAGGVLWCSILAGSLEIGARLVLVVGMMLGGIALASVLLWWPRVLYHPYASADILGGMSPLTDQRTGGGIMLLEGMLVGLGAAAWLIFQLLREREDASPSP